MHRKLPLLRILRAPWSVPRTQMRQLGVEDVGDVAVVVDAGFDQQVRIDGPAQRDRGRIRRVGQCAGDGVIACPQPAQFRLSGVAREAINPVEGPAFLDLMGRAPGLVRRGG